MEMHDAILSALAVVIAIAWVPVLRRFYRSWQDRRSPISLAICLSVLFLIYVNVLLVMVVSFRANVRWALAGGTLFNALSCGNFYMSFRWAKKKYHKDNSSPSVG